MWLSTTHCTPDLLSNKLTPPLFLSSRFSRTWLPSNAKQLNFAMVGPPGPLGGGPNGPIEHRGSVFGQCTC